MKPRMVISYGSPMDLALKILAANRWYHGRPFYIHMSVDDARYIDEECQQSLGKNYKRISTMQVGDKFMLWGKNGVVEEIEPGTAYLVVDS